MQAGNFYLTFQAVFFGSWDGCFRGYGWSFVFLSAEQKTDSMNPIFNTKEPFSPVKITSEKKQWEKINPTGVSGWIKCEAFLGGVFMFFIFTPIWGSHPIWPILFKWVETTNQVFLMIVWSPASTESRPKRSKMKVVNRTCVSLVGHF